MTSQEVYVEIANEALKRLPPCDTSVLACMIVLHTSDFVLTNDCLLDDVVWPPETPLKKLAAVTQRHAAEIIATATGHESDETVRVTWYYRYTTETPYELMKIVPEPLMSVVKQTMEYMLQHPFVADIVEAE